MKNIPRDVHYLKNAIVQYTTYRIAKFVLFIGEDDAALIEALESKGCTVMTIVHGTAKGRTVHHTYYREEELLSLLQGELADHSFDTIILNNLSSSLGPAVRTVLDRCLGMRNRGGNVLLLDRALSFLAQDYVVLEERLSEELALYVFPAHLTEETLGQAVIFVKMSYNLRKAPGLSLGLSGEIMQPEHLDELAACMYDSYLNSTDYEGETPEQTREELANVFSGKYGTWLQQASFVLRRRGRMAGAIVCSLFEQQPLITYVFTLPAYRGQGFARRLIESAIQALRALDYDKLNLFVRLDNESARRVYESLGFIEEGRGVK